MANKKIDTDTLYEYFKDTLSHCGLFLLGLPDEDIAWHLFEEFDTDSISFLHENTLNQLYETGKITADAVDMALALAHKFRKLEGTALWNIPCVRTDPLWMEIFILSDSIKKSFSKSS